MSRVGRLKLIWLLLERDTWDEIICRGGINLYTSGGFFSGQRLKKHEIDHRFDGQFRILLGSVVIINVLEMENVNLKLS